MYRIVIRHPYVVGGLVAAATGTTAVAVSRSEESPSLSATSLVDASSTLSYFNNNSNKNVLIPSMEASLRAVRLVQTAVLMAADYKMNEWGFAVTSELEENQTERAYWEDQVAKRRQALQEAQKYYSRESHHHLPIQERVEAKRKERQAMQEAAHAYAQAEDELATLGSRKGIVHRKAANRLLDLCRTNKGVYIKVGQHIANLDYIVPQEYIDVLSSLFDDTPRTSIEEVRAVVQEDLGMDPDEAFDRFDPEPIASASLAQVHVAYERGTGRKLAVKVQHRGLRETSAGDLYNLITVVRLAERLFPDFSYGWLADEIAPHLPKELDFCNEGKNAERAALNLQRTGLPCIVPKIKWEHTSSRVLTMDFEEGFKATEVEKIDQAGMRRRDVAHLISSVFASQVFSLEDGFVHCDPHPANVLLRKGSNGKPEIVLIDHGLYRHLDRDFQVSYASLWKALMLADLDGIKEACGELGVDQAYTLFAAMLTARPFDELIERSKNNSLRNDAQPSSKADQAMIRGYAQQFLHEIFGLLSRLPRQMLLLLKMNDCLRHIDHRLGSPTNTLVVTGMYAAKALYQENLQRSSSSFERLKNWWSHWRVMMRVHLHNWTVWLLDNVQGKGRTITA